MNTKMILLVLGVVLIVIAVILGGIQVSHLSRARDLVFCDIGF